MGEHGNDWLGAHKAFKAPGGGIRDGGQLLCRRILIQTAVREQEGTVVAKFTVRHTHQEKPRHQLYARSGLQDLKGGTKGIGRGMARSRHHSVRVVGLYHDYAKGEIIGEQDFSRLLRRHPFVFSGLIQKIDIEIQLLAFFRVDDLHTVQLNLQPGCAVHDLFLVPDHDNVRNLLRHYVGCCDQCPLVSGLRQYNRLPVRSRLVLDHVNV